MYSTSKILFIVALALASPVLLFYILALLFNGVGFGR